MTRVRQFYGGDGTPMQVPTAPDDVSRAWLSHRARVREWLASLSDDGWVAPTRCAGWTVADLVQHLASGSQFVGYTLHEAKRGTPTQLLDGFDAQQTAAVAAQMFAGRSNPELLAAMIDMDESAATQIAAFTSESWLATAEAPPGHVPAYVSLNHFLFDSWVHERDLMRPRGIDAVVDDTEALAVVTYVLALAGVAADAADDAAAEAVTMTVRVTDLDCDVSVRRADGQVEVSLERAVDAGLEISGTAEDLVDVATGREPRAPLTGAPAAIGYLEQLATIMA
ncbi:MAG: maleylpyruvate isomerase N-terminal domain-containing protein [Frankiaceae bacterium]|nr:maleylpyruvate isomerase N-terminal domain-containing protein [Frankiaceae bacterium]